MKRIEPNSTTLYNHELDRKQCIHGRPQKFSRGVATSSQVADDGMQMDVH